MHMSREENIATHAHEQIKESYDDNNKTRYSREETLNWVEEC
jgi:hypothetical protein